MLSYQEALQIINSFSKSFGTEMVPMEQALGRTLAEPIFADKDYPPFNRSTKDGYAIKFIDIENGIREFDLVETIFAGQSPRLVLHTGQCYKIMTGAAVPDSADMVIQRELVTGSEKKISIHPDAYKLYQNISKRGEDVAEGMPVIQPPVLCSPATISVLAALGKTVVTIERLPKVAVFTTGDEIVEPGKQVSSNQIRNSNSYLLKALLQKWGIIPFLCEHIKDDKAQLYEMLSKGIAADIMIVSGGVSAGDADYVPEILESLGVKKLFHKLAIKPGKPIWCGKLADGPMVFALPGNPFSNLITFTVFVESYLSGCFGLQNKASLNLPFNGTRSKNTSLDEFFPVAISGNPVEAVPLSFNGSGDILAALMADGIAHHPASVETLSFKTPVNVRLFKK